MGVELPRTRQNGTSTLIAPTVSPSGLYCALSTTECGAKLRPTSARQLASSPRPSDAFDGGVAPKPKKGSARTAMATARLTMSCTFPWIERQPPQRCVREKLWQAWWDLRTVAGDTVSRACWHVNGNRRPGKNGAVGENRTHDLSLTKGLRYHYATTASMQICWQIIQECSAIT